MDSKASGKTRSSSLNDEKSSDIEHLRAIERRSRDEVAYLRSVERKSSRVARSSSLDNEEPSDVRHLKAIERRWQKKWQEAKIFESDANSKKPKFFATFPYPYMNGKLHLGHLYTFLRAEIFSRYKRMRGYNVLFPFAFHCTGTPIVAAARRVKENETKQVKILLDMGILQKDIPKFADPNHWIEYFPKETKADLESVGAAIDWRRSFRTTEINPPYSKFIEWQFRKLKEKGYVVKGEHPVVWCPKDKMATGDHDRVEGEGVVPEEMTLIKFDYNGIILPAATYRPETTFGVTNMWVNPEAEYVEAKVDKEKWIMSAEAAAKLRDQKHSVEILRKLKGSEMVNKYCRNSVTGKEIPILPAGFVDPKIGTGIVMSVPAHAPYDYMALRDVQKSPEKYGAKKEIVEKIVPISLIKIDGFGEFPAAEICESTKIANQNDAEKLDEATSDIYKKEFHTGILKEITGKYAGLKVSEAKDILINDFKREGKATMFYELSSPVVCRCLTRCHTKIIDDQWFMKYSDEAWKKKTHEALNKMKLYPDEARPQFEHVIDWLHDWACSREFGLGTKIPWDRKWLIESLSDSTVYMAYYTIAHIIQNEKIGAEKNYDAVFDYVFLGKGNAEHAAKESGIKKATIEKMRAEFLYWYPFDFRNSAKDLVGNHLTFCIFNHTAIFDENFWPGGFGINGYVTVEGEKMSKSKGNFFTIEQIIKNYGADVSRATYMLGGEGLDDANWDSKLAETFPKKFMALEAAVSKAKNGGNKSKGTGKSHLEKWLISVMNRQIKIATGAMDETKFRAAMMASYYEMQNALRWYERRTESFDYDTYGKFMKNHVKLLAPFAPHLCEELWQRMGNKGFVSDAEWPESDEKSIDIKSEKMEEFVKKTSEDINEIKKIIRKEPEKINIYVSPEWKFDIYEMALAKPKNLIQEVMKNPELKKRGAEAAGFAQNLSKRMNVLEKTLAPTDEYMALNDAEKFFGKELGCKVSVFRAEESTSEKAQKAMPGKPGIEIL